MKGRQWLRKRGRLSPVTSPQTPCVRAFRFCGDLDCPDWVLAEISTLAKMVECTGSTLGGGGALGLGIVGVEDGESSVKLRLLCSQVLKELLGQGIDVSRRPSTLLSHDLMTPTALNLFTRPGETGSDRLGYEKILKLTADTKFESGDVKATVAVLSFILSSAAKHSVDGESLSSELQQLGLPKEHTASLCRCYEEKQTPLQKHLRVCSLRTNRLAGVGWRVDYTLSSSLLQSVKEPMVHLRLEVAAAPGTPAQPVAMSLSADKFQVLLAELKQAQTLMSSLG
ncbi:COMM domain-containing protein 4 [Saguinus oedipus]|uniref:COMM domain-containing protein 4 n=1 Tax=Saguinus oedipus TaxID=9490 RepID=A0ABQ9V237_SAGOE|nr:COMM domain-containing protein 4 [Saguinus oedipus]